MLVASSAGCAALYAALRRATLLLPPPPPPALPSPPAPPCGIDSFIDVAGAGYSKNTNTNTGHGMLITPANQGNNFCKSTDQGPTGHAAGPYASLVYCNQDTQGHFLDAPYCVPVATASADVVSGPNTATLIGAHDGTNPLPAACTDAAREAYGCHGTCRDGYQCCVTTKRCIQTSTPCPCPTCAAFSESAHDDPDVCDGGPGYRLEYPDVGNAHAGGTRVCCTHATPPGAPPPPPPLSPNVPATPPPALPPSQWVLGGAGESCDAACAAKGMPCSNQAMRR